MFSTINQEFNTFSQPSGGALAKNRLILGEFPATVSSGEILSSVN